MNDFSQLGLEDSYYEHTLRQREKAEIRSVAKYVGVAYLLCIVFPEILSYFIIDLATSYASLSFITKIFTHPILSAVYNIVVSAVVFTLPFLVVPMGLTVKTRELVSYKRPKSGLSLPLVLVGLGFCAFANFAANAVVSIFGSFGIENYSNSYSNSKTVPEFIMTFIAVAVAPAIVEEFAFRGIVLGALRKFGDGFAILVSSLVFGLMHRNFAQMPFAFLVGIVLAFATIKTGSIITGMVIHFLNNGLSLVLSTLTANWGSDTAVGIIYSLYFVLCFIFFFMGVALLSSKGKEFWAPQRTTHKLTSRQRVICFFSQPVVILDLFLTLATAATLLTFV